MYFDERPKKSLEDLFGREIEVEKLTKAIMDRRPLIVVSGVRRVGKTSLLGAVLSQKGIYSMFIDPRDPGPKERLSKDDCVQLVRKSLQDFLDNNKGIAQKIIGTLKHVKGISCADVGIELDFSSGELDLKELFSALDKWAAENETSVVLAIDEAQILARSDDYSFDAVLAGIYDKCDNISIVTTGSEMGLLYDFLGDNNTKAYLYGRSRTEIKLAPLVEAKGREFLIQGFKQKGIDVETNQSYINTINEAIKRLDGTLGWLVKFGQRCLSSNEISEQQIKKIQWEGSRQARAEFEKFLETRTNQEEYLVIMRALAKTSSQYDFVQSYVESDEMKSMVEELVTEQFIVKREKKYFFGDPLLQYSFEMET